MARAFSLLPGSGTPGRAGTPLAAMLAGWSFTSELKAMEPAAPALSCHIDRKSVPVHQISRTKRDLNSIKNGEIRIVRRGDRQGPAVAREPCPITPVDGEGIGADGSRPMDRKVEGLRRISGIGAS